MRRSLIFALLASTGLAACNLQPALTLPPAPVPSTLPGAGVGSPAANIAPIGYRDVIVDPRLRTLIDQAQTNNRDLRIAAANIVAARAQYRIQWAARLPGVDFGASGSYADRGSTTSSGSSGASSGGISRAYTANIGVSSFELDFFGRVRSLSDAALNRYLSTESAAQATRLTLIADIADAWSTYAADQALLAIARDTMTSAGTSVRLTQARLSGGVAPRTDLLQAQGVLATAQADVAQQTTAVAQDLNALQLLVGAAVDPALLPASIEETDTAFAVLPAGLESSVLLKRPDVIQAEYDLRAANADIGAARAALFPKISLTGLAGVASSALSSLFSGGAWTWSAGANLSLPLFDGGAGRAGVAYSQAQRDAAVATYERAIQSGFRDAADALARQATIDDQVTAQQAGLTASQESYALTDARYRGGIDSFLTSLIAQRSLYASRQGLVAVQLTRAVNRVALYRALGGGETAGPAPSGG